MKLQMSEEQEFLIELEVKLWKAANKLLPSLDAAVYKHVVLGLVFLKYVSDSFEKRAVELGSSFKDPSNDYYLGEDIDDEIISEELEVKDYYASANVFWVPSASRWSYLQDNIRLSVGSPLPLGGDFKGPGGPQGLQIVTHSLGATKPKENPRGNFKGPGGPQGAEGESRR